MDHKDQLECQLPGDCDYPCACPIVSPQQEDEGTVFIERRDDGSVMIAIRSSGAKTYSYVEMTWDEWVQLRSLDLPIPEPEIQF